VREQASEKAEKAEKAEDELTSLGVKTQLSFSLISHFRGFWTCVQRFATGSIRNLAWISSVSAGRSPNGP